MMCDAVDLLSASILLYKVVFRHCAIEKRAIWLTAGEDEGFSLKQLTKVKIK